MVRVGLGRDLPSLNLSLMSKEGAPRFPMGGPGGKKGQRERCGIKDDSSQIPYFNHQLLNSHIYISLDS